MTSVSAVRKILNLGSSSGIIERDISMAFSNMAIFEPESDLTSNGAWH